MAKRILILGGARSGKSAYAEQRAADYDDVCCLVTAWAGDEEMQARIDKHKADRPATWHTVETGRALAEGIIQHDSVERCLLVDCMTLWLCQWLHDESGQPLPDASLHAAKTALDQAILGTQGTLILIANEIGLGVVPMGAITRRFVDEAGWLNQHLARLVDEVWLVTAGIPMRLK